MGTEMSIQRTVTIINNTDWTCEDRKTYWNAIGYLAMWAIGSPRYENVTLYVEPDGCIEGRYSTTGGEITYTIFGKRDDDGSYTFHS
jgi:hypothetical protein